MPKKIDDNIVENEDLEIEELELEDGEVEEDSEAEIEESVGSETLKPHGGSGGGEYRAQTLSTFVSLLSQLGKEDLTNLFDQVQSQFGPNKTGGMPDKSGANVATIKAKGSAAQGSGAIPAMSMPKLGVKEDIDELFGDDETLTEDFKEKASVIFESALNTRINLELVKLSEEYEELTNELNEEFEAKLEEITEELTTDLTEKVDQYLNYCVEEWMEENKLAIESTLRTEIAEGFITGLQNLFSEHYIEVPEERFDIVAEMKAELEDLRNTLNETLDEKLQLESLVKSNVVETIIDDLSEGLSVTQTEKLRQLSEGVEFTDSENFRKKMSILKESAFKKTSSSDTGLITEEIDGSETNTNGETMHPGMEKYVKAISKS